MAAGSQELGADVDVVSSEVEVDVEVVVSSGGVVVVESAGANVGVSSDVVVVDAGVESGVEVVESAGDDDVVPTSTGVVSVLVSDDVDSGEFVEDNAVSRVVDAVLVVLAGGDVELVFSGSLDVEVLVSVLCFRLVPASQSQLLTYRRDIRLHRSRSSRRSRLRYR